MARLNSIEQQVAQISVPRGFSREFYDMRIHIQMLREKLVAAAGGSCATNLGTTPIDKPTSNRTAAGSKPPPGAPA